MTFPGETPQQHPRATLRGSGRSSTTRLNFHLARSAMPYLVYHHTVRVDFITSIQHVREMACGKEFGAQLGFFEVIKGAIWRGNEKRTREAGGCWVTVGLITLSQRIRKKSRIHI